MTDEIAELLIQIAGFLTLISDGHVGAPPHAVKEAKELLGKIGAQLAEDQ